MKANPEFIVFVGPMFSSKTSKMLMTLERFKYQKKNIIAFKPRIDTRYSDDTIVSHSGWRRHAVAVGSGAEMLEVLTGTSPAPEVVVVDELFMIDGAAETLEWLFRELGLTIVVSTLDLSFAGRPFEEVTKIMPWATHLEKCTAICTVCGEDAPYTHKKADDNEEIVVGGAELYEPRCFAHHVIVNQSK